MIYVSQGHEESISLEVFFKSLAHLPQRHCSLFLLVGEKESIHKNLKNLKAKFQILDDHIIVFGKKIHFKKVKKEITCSTDSLSHILEIIKNDDILFTLPTSKDQLIINNRLAHGHTEFFRKHFESPNIAMMFQSPKTKMVLITDHVPLAKVSAQITPTLINSKVSLILNHYKDIEEVYFSGINPHCGENGLMGQEDSIILESIKELKKFSLKNFLALSPEMFFIIKQVQKSYLSTCITTKALHHLNLKINLLVQIFLLAYLSLELALTMGRLLIYMLKILLITMGLFIV